MREVTRTLEAIERGDARAASELLPLVYDQLKREAQRRMAGERSDHTLQATALSNLIASVRRAVDAGETIEQALASLPLEETYLPPPDSPLAGVRPIMQGFHRWNIKKTYLELAE